MMLAPMKITMLATSPYDGMTPAEAAVEKFLDSVVLGLGLKAAIEASVAAAPFLGLPVIKQLYTYLATELVSFVFKKLTAIGYNFVVDIKVGAERASFDEARDALKEELLKPEEAQDAEELRKLNEEFNRRARDLIRFPKPR